MVGLLTPGVGEEGEQRFRPVILLGPFGVCLFADVLDKRLADFEELRFAIQLRILVVPDRTKAKRLDKLRGHGEAKAGANCSELDALDLRD